MQGQDKTEMQFANFMILNGVVKGKGTDAVGDFDINGYVVG